MTNEEKAGQEENLLNLDYDWYLLGNAQVAAQYLQQGKEGLPLAKKSLEMILDDAHIKDPWLINTVTDSSVVPLTIQNQLKTYSQYRERQTVGDLMARYDADLSKYLGEHADAARQELGKVAGQRLSEVAENIEEAGIIIKEHKFGRSTDEEVAKAKKTKEQYGRVQNTLDALERHYRNDFRMRVEGEASEESIRETLLGMYKPAEDGE